MDIQPLVCLTPLPFCSCFSLHRCRDCFHVLYCHLRIFKVCYVVVGRKSPREHLISLLPTSLFKIYDIYYNIQFDLNPDFLSFSTMPIDSDQLFVSRSAAELRRSRSPGEGGCSFTILSRSQDNIFKAHNLTRRYEKKCSASRHS